VRGQILLQLGRRDEAQKEFAAVKRLQQEATDRLQQQVSGEKYRDPQIGTEQK